MDKKRVILVSGFLVGIILGYILFFNLLIPKKQVIGFLPYWLLSKAKNDYSQYIKTLTFFGLTVDVDGKILKLQSLQEEEPGWSALKSGKVDPFFKVVEKNHQSLSLVVFNGNEASISALLQDPVAHAKNLIEDVSPVMHKYKFRDLNIDIESVQEASDEARLRFSKFISEVKKGMDRNRLGTLTVDISPDSLIHKRLINLPEIVDFVDYIVLMTYDYHYIGSRVSGPVAPLAGVGTVSEYDTNTALQKALAAAPSKKIILGIPLYGYEWETIGDVTRSATIPSSGLTASTRRVEQLLNSCATCSAQFDKDAKESFIIYKDNDTGTFHQIFFPDQQSTLAKIELASQEHLAGIAFWALGYEGTKILEPLKNY